jgi:hypothetical protein
MGSGAEVCEDADESDIISETVDEALDAKSFLEVIITGLVSSSRLQLELLQLNLDHLEHDP